MVRRFPLNVIPRDNRYLISEMACKCYGDAPKGESEMMTALLVAFDDHQNKIGGKVTIKKLIEGTFRDRLFGQKTA